MEYEIKKAGFMDVVDIYSVMSVVTEENRFSGFFMGDDLEYVNNHIRKDGVTYIASVQSKCAGFIIIDIPGEKKHNLGFDINLPYARLFSLAHMDSIAVAPGFRGMGIQKALLEYGEKELTALGYTDFLATVHPDNRVSLNSFLSMGYEIKATKLKYGGALRHILHKSVMRA